MFNLVNGVVIILEINKMHKRVLFKTPLLAVYCTFFGRNYKISMPFLKIGYLNLLFEYFFERFQLFCYIKAKFKFS